jgi:hypothetical protein
MRKVVTSIILALLLSCSNQKNYATIKDGKYYAAHGFHDEYIVVNNDSSYVHYVDGKFINKASWKYLQERRKLSFNEFVDVVNWESGIVDSNPRSGSKLFKYVDNGVLDAGLENLNFIHESLWDNEYHRRK